MQQVLPNDHVKKRSESVDAGSENMSDRGAGALVAFGLGVVGLGLLVMYMLQDGGEPAAHIEAVLYVAFSIGFGWFLTILGIGRFFMYRRGARYADETNRNGAPRSKAAHTNVADGLARRATLGLCMVCKGHLYLGDAMVSCPYCNGTSHVRDLLEWIHVKGTCPACGRHLDEDDVQQIESG